MTSLLPIIVLAIATLGILATGLVSMVKGGEFSEKYSNKLMVARVMCQFLAVVMVVILFSSH